MPLNLTVSDILPSLTELLAQELSSPSDQIDPVRPFAELGLKSEQIVRLSREIESLWQIKLSPVVFFRCPTIETLADYIEHHLPQELLQK